MAAPIFSSLNGYTQHKKKINWVRLIQNSNDSINNEYRNVIYKYGRVAFAKEEDNKGNLPMKFDYDILSNPEDKDIDNQEFVDYIGDILIEVMEEQLNAGKVEFE